MVLTQSIQLFTVHNEVLGYTMALIYVLTMRRWEESICIWTREKSWHQPFTVYGGFQGCKYECNLITTNKCTRKRMLILLFTITMVKNMFFGCYVEVYDSGKWLSWGCIHIVCIFICAFGRWKLNFEYIVENTEETLDDLVDYVERLYVCVRCGRGKRLEAPRFPPVTWNVSASLLNSDYGMNSDEEGWYSKFHKLTVHHPSILRYI